LTPSLHALYRDPVNIKPRRELEQFVRRKVAPVVQQCPGDLKSMLLDAINGPHHPMPDDYFGELRKRIREGKVFR
jgi:hypothetical protein